MIVAVIILFLLMLYFACKYFLLIYATAQLRKNISFKKDNQFNSFITYTTDRRIMKPLVKEINLIFDELQRVQVAHLHEKEIFNQALHNITHDIRTPLTIASGYTQNLILSCPDENEKLQKIKANLERVSKRLEVLLEYQSLTEKENQSNLEVANLSETLRNKLLTYHGSLTEGNFNVDLEFPDEEVYIMSDQEVLERILQNIFGNVLKHGKNRLSIHLKVQNDKVILKIQNESQQEIKALEKLTNRFYSENLSSVEASSGLGLYIVKELVAQTQGEFELDYQKNNFLISLSWATVDNGKSNKPL